MLMEITIFVELSPEMEDAIEENNSLGPHNLNAIDKHCATIRKTTEPHLQLAKKALESLGYKVGV